jgi:hypothetical protein
VHHFLTTNNVSGAVCRNVPPAVTTATNTYVQRDVKNFTYSNRCPLLSLSGELLLVCDTNIVVIYRRLSTLDR